MLFFAIFIIISIGLPAFIYYIGHVFFKITLQQAIFSYSGYLLLAPLFIGSISKSMFPATLYPYLFSTIVSSCISVICLLNFNNKFPICQKRNLTFYISLSYSILPIYIICVLFSAPGDLSGNIIWFFSYAALRIFICVSGLVVILHASYMIIKKYTGKH